MRGRSIGLLASSALAACAVAVHAQPPALPAFDSARAEQRYVDAWRSDDGRFDVDALSRLYAGDTDAVFFEEFAREPSDWSFSRHFRIGRRSLTPGLLSFRIEPVEPLRVVSAGGGRVVTVGTYRLRARFQGTDPMDTTLRQTALWESRDARWVLVHEHRSVPMEDLRCPPR